MTWGERPVRLTVAEVIEEELQANHVELQHRRDLVLDHVHVTVCSKLNQKKSSFRIACWEIVRCTKQELVEQWSEHFRQAVLAIHGRYHAPDYQAALDRKKKRLGLI